MKFMCRLVILLLMVIVVVPAYAADVPQLTVRGEATLDVPADRTLVEVGVETDANSAKSAMEENSEIMIRVISALEEIGLTDNEYETGQLQLHPQWNHASRDGETPAIVGYRASNRVRIKTTNQALVGEMIAAATDAGANNVGRLSFDLSNPHKYRAEAIAKATQNAFSDARALAASADMRIVRVAEISLDNAAPPRPMMMAETFSAKHVAAPIKPGDVTLRASVTLVCEIAPNR